MSWPFYSTISVELAGTSPSTIESRLYDPSVAPFAIVRKIYGKDEVCLSACFSTIIRCIFQLQIYCRGRRQSQSVLDIISSK